MSHPVVHWEIGAKDAAKLREFYAKLFGWKIQVMPEMQDYGYVEPGGEGGIGGGIMPAKDGETRHFTFYVRTDNIQASLAKAEDLGAQTVLGETEIPNVGTIAAFVDPEGNLIGLINDVNR
jgi:predicted enzyme related to lactoylglutathione lyase